MYNSFYEVYHLVAKRALILFSGISYEDITDEITREIMNLGIYLQNNDLIGPNTVIPSSLVYPSLIRYPSRVVHTI